MAATPTTPTGSGQRAGHCPPDPSRLCESCLHVHPLAEFRRRKRGSEHRTRQCRRCHNEFERYRRAAIRARLSKRHIATDLACVRDAVSDQRLKMLCAAMVAGYGGTEGFVKAWLGCLHGDLAKGGFAALRHLEAVIRLVQYCEANKPNYRQMTDEQLMELAASLQQF